MFIFKKFGYIKISRKFCLYKLKFPGHRGLHKTNLYHRLSEHRSLPYSSSLTITTADQEQLCCSFWTRDPAVIVNHLRRRLSLRLYASERVHPTDHFAKRRPRQQIRVDSCFSNQQKCRKQIRSCRMILKRLGK